MLRSAFRNPLAGAANAARLRAAPAPAHVFHAPAAWAHGGAPAWGARGGAPAVAHAPGWAHGMPRADAAVPAWAYAAATARAFTPATAAAPPVGGRGRGMLARARAGGLSFRPLLTASGGAAPGGRRGGTGGDDDDDDAPVIAPRVSASVPGGDDEGDEPPTGGTRLGNFMRARVNAAAESVGGVNDRPHHYRTPDVHLGSVEDLGGARGAFERARGATVGYTVPGAVRGAGGAPFGEREEGGTAFAVGGGPVTTESDPEALTITNHTQPGHLLHPGRITQHFVERDGHVYSHVEGVGAGNFARLNEAIGRPLFTAQQYMQRAALLRRSGSGASNDGDSTRR